MKPGFLLGMVVTALVSYSCRSAQEKIYPVEGAVTESVYASGIIRTDGQYQAFAAVNGIIDSIFVEEGMVVSKGQVLMTIASDQQKLTVDNARLAARFASLPFNQQRIREMQRSVSLAADKLTNDSALFARQQRLWQQKIGTLVEFEQRRLQLRVSSAALLAAQRQLTDLRRKIALEAGQSHINLQISQAQQNQFRVVSRIDGIIFDVLRKKGESVSPQTPLAIVGNPGHYVLEMQVDEYDIARIFKGARVIITMDSYRGKVFEGRITKVYPIMNSQTRTFKVEAALIEGPSILYPNLTFEANIVTGFKKKAMLIPTRCLVNDSTVVRANGDQAVVKTGLRDFEMVEVLSGLSVSDELILPKP